LSLAPLGFAAKARTQEEENSKFHAISAENEFIFFSKIFFVEQVCDLLGVWVVPPRLPAEQPLKWPILWKFLSLMSKR